MKLKQGDNVVILSGKDKGKSGEVKKTYPKTGQILVEGMNVKTKFRKKGQGQPGEQYKIEKPFASCKAMLLDPATKKPTRVGYTKVNGKKVRISKKSGGAVDKATTKTKAAK